MTVARKERGGERDRSAQKRRNSGQNKEGEESTTENGWKTPPFDSTTTVLLARNYLQTAEESP
jgi:hypothetical protein